LNKPNVAALEHAAERLRKLTRLFRSANGRVLRQWNPLIIPKLCDAYGMDVVEELLSQNDSLEELVTYVTDNKVAPKAWKLDKLLSQVKKHGCSAVWQVLASRDFTLKTCAAAKGAFEKLIKEFANAKKSDMEDVEDDKKKKVTSPKAQELVGLRKELIAILSK
jgi:hypothetical protein